MKPILYITLLAFSLVGCEDFFDSPIDYQIESPEPKLVVNAQLSPDSIARIEVSQSAPIFNSNGQEPAFLNQATVVLYEDGVFWDSLVYEKTGWPNWILDSLYMSKKVIKANANYTIKVNQSGFNEVNAVTRVPERTNPVAFTWVDFDRQLAKLTLPALKPQEYYFIRFYNSQGWQIYFSSNTPIIEFDADAFIDIGLEEPAFFEGWIRPERMNGQAQEVLIDFVFNVGSPSDVFVELVVVEENLFKYRLDLGNYDPDNPFNEPVQVQSNVQNGYGLFSAYAETLNQIQ